MHVPYKVSAFEFKWDNMITREIFLQKFTFTEINCSISKITVFRYTGNNKVRLMNGNSFSQCIDAS